MPDCQGMSEKGTPPPGLHDEGMFLLCCMFHFLCNTFTQVLSNYLTCTDLCLTLNFTASPENPEASETLPSFTIPLGGHTGHYRRAVTRNISELFLLPTRKPSRCQWIWTGILNQAAFTIFFKYWQRRSHISRCEDPQLPAQTALEGRGGWKASVLCWMQHLQGATRGIKGPVSFLEKNY